MAGFSISVDDRQVLDALRELQARTANLRQPMTEIGAVIKDQTRLRFREQADPWGGTWQPLSAATRARRRKGSDKALLDTGRLRNSITYQAGIDSVTIGTNTVYAALQQFGAKKGQFGNTRRGAPIPWGDIPGRPFLPVRADGRADLPQSWKGDVLSILMGYLGGAW